jgi:hypothetical protein
VGPACEFAECPIAPFSFSREGVLTMIGLGEEKNIPYLMYQADGSSTVSQRLTFDGGSLCGDASECLEGDGSTGVLGSALLNKVGKRVKIDGVQNGTAVLVRVVTLAEKMIATSTPDVSKKEWIDVVMGKSASALGITITMKEVKVI